VLHMDVAKIDRDVAHVAYVASVSDECRKRLFKMFICFRCMFTSVFIRMMHMFHTYVANVCFQMFHLFQTYVAASASCCKFFH
jgi:NADH:ubiquinone oxidoreductase subunit K